MLPPPIARSVATTALPCSCMPQTDSYPIKKGQAVGYRLPQFLLQLLRNLPDAHRHEDLSIPALHQQRDVPLGLLHGIAQVINTRYWGSIGREDHVARL